MFQALKPDTHRLLRLHSEQDRRLALIERVRTVRWARSAIVHVVVFFRAAWIL